MPEPLEQQIVERVSALSKKPAKRLHEVIASLKSAQLLKRSEDIPLEHPQEAAERLDPDFASNLKKLDTLNQIRSTLRKRKRRRRAPEMLENSDASENV